MDENHAHCAFARCFFIFVSPAPVIGQRFAFEKFGIVRWRLIHQHQQHFAAHIHALVVVPVIFRSFDAVAHIDNFGIDIGLRLLGLIVGDILVERLQIHRRAVLGQQHKLGLRQSCDSHQRNLLQVRSVVAGRLQSVFGKLCGYIFGCDVAAALAGAAAFEQIMRQKADMPANVFRIDRFHRRKCGRGQAHRDPIAAGHWRRGDRSSASFRGRYQAHGG